MNTKAVEAAICRNRAKKLRQAAAAQDKTGMKVMLMSAAKDMQRAATEARLAANGDQES